MPATVMTIGMKDAEIVRMIVVETVVREEGEAMTTTMIILEIGVVDATKMEEGIHVIDHLLLAVPEDQAMIMMMVETGGVVEFMMIAATVDKMIETKKQSNSQQSEASGDDRVMR